VSGLEKDFDAIFLGIGLGRGSRMNIPGEDLPEVIEALDFIEQIHTKPLHEVPVGNRVAIIGGGNTAIDAVTQAKRLGAERAVLIYRRGEAEMPAYVFEQEMARADGAEFLFHAAPVEVIADGTGHVSGLRLARTSVTAGKVQLLPETEFVEPFDMVITAIGEQKQARLLKSWFPQLELDARGVVVHNPETRQTSIPHIFTGGDCANGGREVVNAVAEGKKAARGIHTYFAWPKVTGPIQPSRYGVTGQPLGSGLDRPIRVPELEAEYAKQNGAAGSRAAVGSLVKI
jgi:dihydropyrimidine dehydrogenase (NAD+) subunit PreT